MFKSFIKDLFRLLGYDIHHNYFSLNKFVELLQIDLILDIGANEGQYAKSLIRNGYKNRIVSFEPATTPHLKLLKNSVRFVNWEVFERCAIADKNGTQTLNISKNSVSSSLLEMLPETIKIEPKVIYIDQETCKTLTLDTVYPRLLGNSDRLFIKIDTQGYERFVLQGGIKTVKRAIAIQIELSLIPLYESQGTYSYLIEEFRKIGFVLWQLTPVLLDKNGRLVQVDAFFINEKMI